MKKILTTVLLSTTMLGLLFQPIKSPITIIISLETRLG